MGQSPSSLAAQGELDLQAVHSANEALYELTELTFEKEFGYDPCDVYSLVNSGKLVLKLRDSSLQFKSEVGDMLALRGLVSQIVGGLVSGVANPAVIVDSIVDSVMQAIPATSLSAKQSIVTKPIYMDDMRGETAAKRAYQYYQVFSSLSAVCKSKAFGGREAIFYSYLIVMKDVGEKAEVTKQTNDKLKKSIEEKRKAAQNAVTKAFEGKSGLPGGERQHAEPAAEAAAAAAAARERNDAAAAAAAAAPAAAAAEEEGRSDTSEHDQQGDGGWQKPTSRKKKHTRGQ